MSATQKTTNLQLPVYASTDFTTWQDFNDAMEIIDTAYGKSETENSTNAQEIENNSNAIDALQKAVTANTNTSSANNTQITALSTRMTAVESKNINQDASITALENDITQLQNQFNGLPENLGDTIASIQTKNTQQDTAISTAQAEADTATQTAQNAVNMINQATSQYENLEMVVISYWASDDRGFALTSALGDGTSCTIMLNNKAVNTTFNLQFNLTDSFNTKKLEFGSSGLNGLGENLKNLTKVSGVLLANNSMYQAAVSVDNTNGNVIIDMGKAVTLTGNCLFMLL